MNGNDLRKEEVDIIMEEYKRVEGEISKRLDFLDKNINYQFILLGIVATAITTVLVPGEGTAHSANFVTAEYILLVSPIVFYVLGFYYALNNLFIFELGKYIFTHIKVRLGELVQSTQPDKLLNFEYYFMRKVLWKKGKSQHLLAIIALQWTLFLPIILLGGYFFLKFAIPGGYSDKFVWWGPQFWLLVINACLIVVAAEINYRQLTALRN